MGRFKVGQAVTLKENINWKHYFGKPSCVPQFGVVYHVSRSFQKFRKKWIDLKELQATAHWEEVCFEPLVSDAVLEKELESVPEHFTV